MTEPRRGRSRRQLRTSAWRRRARQKFWIEHGEKVRLALIGGGVVVVVSSVAVLALR